MPDKLTPRVRRARAPPPPPITPPRPVSGPGTTATVNTQRPSPQPPSAACLNKPDRGMSGRLLPVRAMHKHTARPAVRRAVTARWDHPTVAVLEIGPTLVRRFSASLNGIMAHQSVVDRKSGQPLSRKVFALQIALPRFARNLFGESPSRRTQSCSSYAGRCLE